LAGSCSTYQCTWQVAHSITVRTSVIPAPNPPIDRAALRIEPHAVSNHGRECNDNAVAEERISPEPVLEQIENRTGIALELIAMARHGHSGGAAYVRWTDGREGILTCPPVSIERMRLTAETLALAKSRGLPVPQHDLVVSLADARTAVVQERLPGRHIRSVNVAMVGATSGDE